MKYYISTIYSQKDEQGNIEYIKNDNKLLVDKVLNFNENFYYKTELYQPETYLDDLIVAYLPYSISVVQSSGPQCSLNLVKHIKNLYLSLSEPLSYSLNLTTPFPNNAHTVAIDKTANIFHINLRNLRIDPEGKYDTEALKKYLIGDFKDHTELSIQAVGNYEEFLVILAAQFSILLPENKLLKSSHLVLFHNLNFRVKSNSTVIPNEKQPLHEVHEMYIDSERVVGSKTKIVIVKIVSTNFFIRAVSGYSYTTTDVSYRVGIKMDIFFISPSHKMNRVKSLSKIVY